MVNVLGFDVAREENMSPDDPVLKLILNKLPKDKEWDANIPRESALLEANEFRYYYNKNALGSWAVEVSSSSKAEAWADKGNVKLQNLQNKLTGTPTRSKGSPASRSSSLLRTLTRKPDAVFRAKSSLAKTSLLSLPTAPCRTLP